MPSDSPFYPLATEADWAEACADSKNAPVVLFKHSSACPVSARAESQMKQLADADDAPPVYRLVVQESRALSNQIAETLGIRHETPQAIVLNDEAPVFDASHGDVTAETVQNAVASSPAPSSA